MGLATIIKTKIGSYTLNKISLQRNRKKLFFNFETAKTVAIVFDATSNQEYTAARFLSNYMLEKRIRYRCIGFLKPHDVPESGTGSLGFTFFTEKDFSITGKPLSATVIEFCNNEFDILIDLHLINNFFIDAVVAFSLAHMKIGLTKHDKGFYDFMLQLHEPIDAENMIEHIKTYMNIIKTA
ncbi:MAG: hypothetical protein N2449_04515 [Bacteroidales bacterium]|nr:hypothetical protein [Bacteroidales bacterium]